jgi:AcrR family transcriptional regulator
MQKPDLGRSRRRLPARTARQHQPAIGTAAKSERPLRRRLREATREALLAAAEATITSRGIDDTRIEDIAAAAGVAVGTIYNYFADRKTLVEALLELRRREAVLRLQAALEMGARQNFPERVDRFLRALARQFDEHRPLVALFMAHEMAEVRATKRPGHAFHELVGQAAELIDGGVARGEIDPDGADALPVLLLGMMRGLIARSLYQKPVPIEPLVPIVARVFCAGAMRRS